MLAPSFEARGEPGVHPTRTPTDRPVDPGDPGLGAPARATFRRKTAPVSSQRSAGALPRRTPPGTQLRTVHHLTQAGKPGLLVGPVAVGLGVGIAPVVVTGRTFEAGAGVGGGVANPDG